MQKSYQLTYQSHNWTLIAEDSRFVLKDQASLKEYFHPQEMDAPQWRAEKLLVVQAFDNPPQPNYVLESIDEGVNLKISFPNENYTLKFGKKMLSQEERLEKMETLMFDLIQRDKQREDKIGRLEDQLAHLEKENTNLRKEIADQKDHVAFLDKEVAALNKNVTGLNKEDDKLKDSLKKCVSFLNNGFEDIEIRGKIILVEPRSGVKWVLGPRDEGHFSISRHNSGGILIRNDNWLAVKHIDKDPQTVDWNTTFHHNDKKRYAYS